LKLQYDEPPSNFALYFKLRRYSTVPYRVTYQAADSWVEISSPLALEGGGDSAGGRATGAAVSSQQRGTQIDEPMVRRCSLTPGSPRVVSPI